MASVEANLSEGVKMWRKIGIALCFLFVFLMGKATEKRKVQIQYINCQEESVFRAQMRAMKR